VLKICKICDVSAGTLAHHGFITLRRNKLKTPLYLQIGDFPRSAERVQLVTPSRLLFAVMDVPKSAFCFF
jgi:hypothetical protein